MISRFPSFFGEGMVMRRIILGVLIAVVATVASSIQAAALPIEVFTDFRQGFGGSLETSQSDSAASSGASVTLSKTFSGTTSLPPGPPPPLGIGTGAANLSATATGAFDSSGLRFGASGGGTASLTGLTANTYSAQASGLARFTDTVAVVGVGDGIPVILRLSFDVDGTFSAFADNTNDAGAEAGLTFGAGWMSGSASLFTSLVDSPFADPQFAGTHIPVPDVFIADLPGLAGTPSPLTIALNAFFTGSFQGTTGSGTASGASDFDSTFVLRLAQVLDADGNPIPGARIISSNDFVYPTGAAAAIPEPSTIWLVGVGVACFIAVSRFRQVTTR